MVKGMNNSLLKEKSDALQVNLCATFCDARAAKKILGCSDRTLIRYRQQGKLLAGIHWGRNPSGKVLYNQTLLNNLVNCGGNINHPDHQKFIQQYLNSLPENQPRLPGRKRGKVEGANREAVVG